MTDPVTVEQIVARIAKVGGFDEDEGVLEALRQAAVAGIAASPSREREALEQLIEAALNAVDGSAPTNPLRSAISKARDALTLPEQPRPTSMGIMKLKWSEPHPSHTFPNWIVQVAVMGFTARIDTSKPAMFGKFPLSINGFSVEVKFETLEAAQAYAQDDFESRVRALLTVEGVEQPRPVDDVERMREALDRISSQALCHGMRADEAELRDWLRNIAEIAEGALGHKDRGGE